MKLVTVTAPVNFSCCELGIIYSSLTVSLHESRQQAESPTPPVNNYSRPCRVNARCKTRPTCILYASEHDPGATRLRIHPQCSLKTEERGTPLYCASFMYIRSSSNEQHRLWNLQVFYWRRMFHLAWYCQHQQIAGGCHRGERKF